MQREAARKKRKESKMIILEIISALIHTCLNVLKIYWFIVKVILYIFFIISVLYGVSLIGTYRLYYRPMMRDIAEHPEQREYNTIPTWKEGLRKCFESPFTENDKVIWGGIRDMILRRKKNKETDAGSAKGGK